MRFQHNLHKNIKTTEDVNRKAITSKMLYAKIEKNLEKIYRKIGHEFSHKNTKIIKKL